MTLALGLSYMAFDCVEVGSFCAHLLESFYHIWMLNFVKNFLRLLRWSYSFYLFSLLIWFITLIDLWVLKNPYIPRINPSWSWCIILLMYCWISFASILLKIFVSVLISDIGACNFLFLCVWRLWFRCQDDSGFIEWVWECSFLCNFLSFRGVKSSLNVW